MQATGRACQGSGGHPLEQLGHGTLSFADAIRRRTCADLVNIGRSGGLTTMSAGASPGKRREMDVMKLMMSDWKVELVNDNISEFNVLFKGPPESAFPGRSSL